MKGFDPIVMAVAAMLLVIVAFGAGFIPAHRASRMHPMQALQIRIAVSITARIHHHAAR